MGQNTSLKHVHTFTQALKQKINQESNLKYDKIVDFFVQRHGEYPHIGSTKPAWMNLYEGNSKPQTQHNLTAFQTNK